MRSASSRYSSVELLQPLLGKLAIEHLDDDLIYLGRWHNGDAQLPLYFARRIDQPKSLQRLDLLLRSRQDGGVGIVLSAGQTEFKHLGPNIVIPLGDVLQHGQIDDDAKAIILERFQAGRWLALGGSEVGLSRFGAQFAMLHIPGKVPLAVSGSNQIMIIDRLVAAYLSGKSECRTGDLVDGTGVRSPADAWRGPARNSVSGVYVENHRRNFWRLKTDATSTTPQ